MITYRYIGIDLCDSIESYVEQKADVTCKRFIVAHFLFSRLFLFLSELVPRRATIQCGECSWVDNHSASDACRSEIFNKPHIYLPCLPLSRSTWWPLAATIDFCYRAWLCSRESAWNVLRHYTCKQKIFLR